MMRLVSVIMPAYNCRKFIGEAIYSVIHQTYPNFELIIVDDGSTDGQEEIILQLRKIDRRLKYIRQRNRGVSAARNSGFCSSKGDFIAFMDADDVWLPNNLEVKVSRLEQGDAGMVHSDAVIIDEYSKPGGTILSGMEGYVLDPLLLWEGTQIPGPSSILMKREVLETVGLFDEKLSTAADKDMFIRVAASFKVARIAEVTWQYRIHKHNMHKNIAVMESDMISIYRKARNLNLFKNRSFERRCFAAMYLVLAASWAGDGRSPGRSILYLLRAFSENPLIVFSLFRRAINRFRPH